jgi:hypothetical protein
MAEFGNAEFFRSLGQYVYAYIDDGEIKEWEYVGKGNGNRGIQHIKSKGYNIDNLYIVARNLEKFENKQDWQSFLLESFIISTFNPKNNSVSGHYKECFVMAKFSEMFTEFKDSQYDNFAELPEWYLSNYSILKNRIGVMAFKKENVYIEGATKNSMAMSFYVDAISNEVTQVKISIWGGAAGEIQLENYGEKVQQFLSELEYSDDQISQVGSRNNHRVFQIEETNIQKVLNLFDQFMS